MSAQPFRVALSHDFLKSNGEPAFPMFDLSPLTDHPGVELRYLDPCEEVRAADMEDTDALILLLPRFTAASVPASGRLKVVARFGVGYDNVDVDACTRAGIMLVITPDGVRRPVAVSILTLMLALAGKLMVKDRLARQGPAGWAERIHHMGTGPTGRTLGVLGVGNIGLELFRICAPLDMRFIAHDPFIDPSVSEGLGVRFMGLEELFREADFLSVNCPLTPETRGIVDAERLALMKPTAYLINTARGPVVDQRALTTALQQGTIAGAGLDVLAVEPPDPDEPILNLDNVILSPHALCWTDECFAGNGAADVRAVLGARSAGS